MVTVDDMLCVSSSSCNVTEDNVVSLMYIVARGLRVTTKACMNLANGRARKLPRPSVMEHHGRVTKCVAEFVVSRNFRNLYMDVVLALKFCVAIPGSEWTVVREFSAASGAAIAKAKAKKRKANRVTK